MAYQSLLFADSKVEPKTAKEKKVKPKIGLGCEGCPLNKSHKHKFITKPKGRSITLWLQSPNEQENENETPLTNSSKQGRFFWEHASVFGFERKDFDIQYVVRCRSTERDQRGFMKDRAPVKEELVHCSVHTDEAVRRISSKVHVVLGQVAAKQLLGKEFKKTRRIFWSDKLNAKVICIDAPGYVMRDDAPKARKQEFKEGLKLAAELLKGPISRFAYVEKQDYGSITKRETAERWAEQIEREAIDKGKTVYSDIESGKIKDEPVLVCTGFCYQKGVARTFYLNHPEVPRDNGVLEVVDRLYHHHKLKLAFHYGTSDVHALADLARIKVPKQAFQWDTNFSEFFAYSNRKKYALGEIAQERFPRFAGYKEIHYPYTDNGKNMNMALVPKKILTIYNSADCDVSLRAGESVRGKIPEALVKVYTYASHVLFDMQKRGPAFDMVYFETVAEIVSSRLAYLKEQLQMLAGDPEFNPNSPDQVAKVMYEVLEIPKLTIKGEEQSGTAAVILETLGREYEFPKLEQEYRELFKLNSTYLIGFLTCAQLNDEELRTMWWLTGASTGRMSSGGGKGNDNPAIVNLQNVARNPLIKNLLISDRRWRDVLNG